MKISLLTDAKRHNLALMKLSAWHKANGDDVALNMPIMPADYRYASVLFEQNVNRFRVDEIGGPAVSGSVLSLDIEKMKPDYDLFPVDYSLGYTFRPCYNSCDFCKVPKMSHPDTRHHSIWEFHDARFKKICILNNNTFQDPLWKATFEEIWDARLIVVDENGYDLRLMDEEKADALHKTKWATRIHFAWDRMCDEPLVTHGLRLAKKYRLKASVYVLIGYNTTPGEDIHRCQVIHDHGLTPYPMPYVKTDYTRAFKRFINLHYYRMHSTIKAAWDVYK